MSQGSFLYYIPGVDKSAITRGLIASRQEGAALFDLIHSPRDFSLRLLVAPLINGGPDGGGGCIISPQPVSDCGQKIGYYPDTQTWRCIKGSWIGFDNDFKPGPDSLQRPAIVQGYEVELCDSNMWIAPTIRAFHERTSEFTCQLPLTIGVDDDGNHTARVSDRYRDVWEKSADIGNIVFNGKHASIQDRYLLAVDMLSVNYRIGQYEASILELMDSDRVSDVLAAAVDGEMVNRLAMNKEPDKNPSDRPGTTSI